MDKLGKPSEDIMAYEKNEASFDWLALWILISTWSSLSGWFLSALGCLNSAGIVISYSVFLVGVVLFRSHLRGHGRLIALKILRSRQFAPKLWLLLAIIAVVGGIAHSPNNYDYLTYRFTRVLYWTWEHGWYWVPTVNERINFSGPGFEWLMVPLYILFKTDRLFFLINVISYLLLPTVIFSVFSSLGISKRISWWWMWVLPCGYCFILQAGSVGNDSFAAVYFLASLHYLFQTKISSPQKNLAYSCLAIALMTAAKASNLPLVLPWLALLFFHRKYFLKSSRPAITAMVLIVAVAVSFLPMALLNIHFTGDFAGDPQNSKKLKVSNPVIGVLGNSIQLAKDSLVPPLLPQSVDWGPHLPPDLKVWLLRGFPRLDLHSGELQIEEEAGIGLGIVLYAGLFIVAGVGARMAGSNFILARNRQALWLVAASSIALLGYMSKMGSESTSRLMAAYYPMLIAAILLLVSLDGRIVQRRIFKWLGILAMYSALPLVILCPARPLFPAQVVANIMEECRVPSKIIERYNDVYGVYSVRADCFKDLIAVIPPSERAVGFLQNSDAPEAALWRPFGVRKVVDVTPKDSIEEMKSQGIQYVVISGDALTYNYHVTLASLMAKWPGTLVTQKSIVMKAHLGAEEWYLLRL